MPPGLGPRDPAPPACLCYMVAVGTMQPADTPRHCPLPWVPHLPQPEHGGQEGVNATGKGLWGRKKAVPTGLRCQGERPALRRRSHHCWAPAAVHPSVRETGADLVPLPCGAPWHPGPSTPSWPSACPRRARRAAGAGLTMHHRALCVLALGTLGKGGGGGPFEHGHGGPGASEGTVMAGGRDAENESRWRGRGSRSYRVLVPHSQPTLRAAAPASMAAQMALCCLRHSHGLGVWGQKSLPRGLLRERKPGLVRRPPGV